MIKTLKNLSRYTEAELTAAVINAYLTVFVTSKETPIENDWGIGEAITGTDQSILNNQELEDQKIELGSGTSNTLNPGEDITMVDPKRPNQNYKGFFDATLQELGMNTGIPFEILRSHFESSYSASRANLLEFGKTIAMYETFINTGYNQPIYEEWFADEVASGRIKAPGFFSDPMIRYAYTRSEWSSSVPRGSIQPLQEAKAITERNKIGLTSLERDFKSIYGSDYASERKRILKEKKDELTKELISIEKEIKGNTNTGNSEVTE